MQIASSPTVKLLRFSNPVVFFRATARNGRVKIVEEIPVVQFFKKFKTALKLSLIAGEAGMEKKILEKSINRPGIALTGFLKYFAYKRIQLFGAGEMAYLKTLTEKQQSEILDQFAAKGIPCIVVSRNLIPLKSMVAAAERHRIALFRSPMSSKDFTTTATLLLEYEFAPRITEHGTLLDIRGIGTLLKGKSGIGKSECALALIERGHSLVADDLTFIKLINETELVGSSSELSRGYMECRGIGIINVAELFGIRNVRLEKRIDLIISFEEWTPDVEEDRTGLEENFYAIMGVQVPMISIYVRPGRDLARLVEVAAMVQAAKIMGHDCAQEFNERLIATMAKPS